MKSIWDYKVKDFKKLDENLECDTLIIGGGVAGLWCAYKLIKAGKKVVILEAAKVGLGVTSGSSAILSYAQENVEGVYRLFGEDVASQHLNDIKQAIKNITQVIKEENFDCDVSKTVFSLYATKHKGIKQLKKIAGVYELLGEPFFERNETELPYKKTKAISFQDCYLIDPLMLVSELTKYIINNGGRIYENTLITSAPDGNELVYGNYKIRAKNFIVATHFPYINFPGFYFLKMYQDQNYSIVVEPGKQFKNLVKGETFESLDEKGLEFRQAKNYMLCCGPDVRTGAKPHHSKYQVIKKHLQKFYDDPKEITRFSAQDCITSDYLPYAGLYSYKYDNVYLLSGFNKWGMTNSFITADVVCNMILGKTTAQDENIYSPTRNNFFVTIIDTLTNLGVTVGSLINDLFSFDSKKFERIKEGQGAIVKHKGHRLGVYRDKNSRLHVISGICPHLGCCLKWNKDETSWDCPCHGSRFDVDGKIINNPSTQNAEKIKCKLES